MRLVPVCLILSVLLTGCGYVGDPLPPALNIPKTVTNLTAVQRGSNIIVTFTAPARTVEDLGIRQFGDMDLQIGGQHIKAPLPEPGTNVTVETPAAEFAGRDVQVLVRLLNTRGRWSSFSNAVALTVGKPLPVPDVKAQTHPEGVRVSWTPTPGTQYRITRRAEGEENFAPAGTSSTGNFIDKNVTFGKPYTYIVQAANGKQESEPSPATNITPRDEFAPAPPAGLAVVVGLKSMEVTWDRNAEPDLATYRVYRAEGTGDFSVLADTVEGTAFSDRQVTSGTKYRYRVTASDKSGNESEPSKVVEATAP